MNLSLAETKRVESTFLEVDQNSTGTQRRKTKRRPREGPVELALRRVFAGKDPVRVVKLLAMHLMSTVRQQGPPFSPFRYADALGLRVERAAILADGMLADWPSTECRILLRMRDGDEHSTFEARRENFTLAHEIGHFLIRSHLDGFVPRSFFSSEHGDEERLCNRFAAELLMPSYMVRDHFSDLSPRARSVLSLCDLYDVSLQAMLVRLGSSLRARFFAVIWRKRGEDLVASWATPTTFRDAVLCQNGKTSVERAFGSTKEENGRDCLVIGGRHIRPQCSSIGLSGGRVLTIRTMNLEGSVRRSSGFSGRPEGRSIALQLQLPFNHE